MPLSTSLASRPMSDEDRKKSFKFRQPPECPVFEPSSDEFNNPMEYIGKIRSVAEKSGICKIKPPPDWQPPFAVDVDKFKFVPRIQRLNELEAQTRVKLNFLDKIAKYWQLQGSPLKIPVVERKTLDLYLLYNLVQKYGGMAKLDKLSTWHIVADKMGFGKNCIAALRVQYVKILHPFDVFTKLKLIKTEGDSPEKKMLNIKDEKKPDIKLDLKTEQGNEVKIEATGSGTKRHIEVVDLLDDEDEESSKKPKTEVEMEGTAYTPHGIESRQAVKRPCEKYARRVPSCFNKDGDSKDGVLDTSGDSISDKSEEGKANKELQRLAFFGAGPKLPGYDPSMKNCESKTRGKRVNYAFDPLEKYTCKTCEKGDKEDTILLCDECDDSYHTHCLIPPLLQVPEGEWRCPQCVALVVGKPIEAFGFEQAQREYTLQQFGEMADAFKKNYFQMPGYSVPTEEVEREFWRVVSCIDEDVTVQYGADLHTMDHGSGFPTAIADNEEMALELEYAKSPWNLNNLPVCEGSVLQYIDSDISGMKVPWMYVGMCFATFCWHNEDHWNYSINYLHWGEAKTWYGVPGSEADKLEETMKKLAPELFENQPDLLQQLVTIMNPNLLMEHNVPVVRTDQQAGEFVVTFPRAYHAGFNQGYNFAEAVNFAPAEWIKVGRECVEHYKTLHRYCVFSHDELICKMAERPERLSQHMAEAVWSDVIIMVRNENHIRKELKSWGIIKFFYYKFDDLPDDERVCEICRTTCFLSAVSCECQNGGTKIACLKHFKELCACPPQRHFLRMKYSLDQLLNMMRRLQVIYIRPGKRGEGGDGERKSKER